MCSDLTGPNTVTVPNLNLDQLYNCHRLLRTAQIYLTYPQLATDAIDGQTLRKSTFPDAFVFARRLRTTSLEMECSFMVDYMYSVTTDFGISRFPGGGN